MMFRILLLGIMISSAALAGNAPDGNALAYFKEAEKLEELRNSRQVSMKEITEMLKDKNTVLLDTRSDQDFKRLHIRGAKHLSYADFTTDRITKMFPDKNTRIIVYCDKAIANPLTRMMALSTNAFVDLHMQGYSNIYEMQGASQGRTFLDQCRNLMDIPFEGDSRAIASLKQGAVSCLSR